MSRPTAGASGSAGATDSAGASGSAGGVAAGGVAAGGVAAGGDGGTSTEPTPEPVAPFEGPPVQYWTDAAEQTRVRYEECLGVRARQGMLSSNVVSAHYLVQAEVAARIQQAQPSLTAGRAQFDAQRAAECLNRIATITCEELRRDAALGYDCIDSALVGLVPRGGECGSWLECADARDYCDRQPEAGQGHCAPRARAGESCNFVPCIAEAECEGEGGVVTTETVATCVPRPRQQPGGPCQAATDCVEGAFCNGHQVCRAYADILSCSENGDCPYLQACVIAPGYSTGTCGRGRDEGEPCRLDPQGDDCTFSWACRPDATGANVCTTVWVEAGQMCRNTGGDRGIVCIDGYCDILDRATQEGVCVPADELGDPCHVGSCAPGLECTETGCRPALF